MAQPLAIFNYEGNQVRIVERDGEPWFISTDVAQLLGYRDAHTACRYLDADEKDTLKSCTLGGRQDMIVINESGLYSLILRSSKEEAKRFKKWITSEVLPSIRKTGTYSMQPQELIARAVIEAHKLIEAQTLLIADLTPKAAFFDAVTDSTDAVDIGTVAKVLNCGIGRTKLFEFLREEQILMKNNIPFQRHVDSGYFRVIESSYGKPDGSTHINFKTVVFQKGIQFIRQRLEKRGAGYAN